MNEKFQNWKLVSEALLRVQGFYFMYEGCVLQIRLSKILNVFVDQRLGQAFVSKHLFQNMRLELSRAFETLGRVFKAFTWAVQTLSQAFEGLTENL